MLDDLDRVQIVITSLVVEINGYRREDARLEGEFNKMVEQFTNTPV